MVRHKMSREERAKQFMPFAALKGYTEALRRKEEEIEAQRRMLEKGVTDAEIIKIENEEH